MWYMCKTTSMEGLVQVVWIYIRRIVVVVNLQILILYAISLPHFFPPKIVSPFGNESVSLSFWELSYFMVLQRKWKQNQHILRLHMQTFTRGTLSSLSFDRNLRIHHFFFCVSKQWIATFVLNSLDRNYGMWWFN